MTKTYLGYLNNADIIRDLAEDDPVLIFFICFLGDEAKFQSNIFNFETDCRKLSTHYDITTYLSPKERSTHHVNCRLRKENFDIFDELVKSHVCTKFKEFFNLMDENGERVIIDRLKFRQLFWEYFTFDDNPEDTLNNILNKMKKEFNISLPEEDYIILEKDGNFITFHRTLEGQEIFFIIKVKCSCGHMLNVKIHSNLNHFEDKMPYNLQCENENCRKIFNIAYNFFYCKYYSP